MSNILNSEDFGLKIYNRFPPKYREDDVSQNFALKRYLQSLSDGGFKHSIDEINGIADLVNPDKVNAKILPILFEQYGLKIFNGIPEQYLRYLLPRLGEAWSKKGSLSVVEFITSSLSGIKTSTNVVYDEDDNPTVEVRFEMDYNIGDYFPDSKQFEELLSNFLPYYSDSAIIYVYMFYENTVLNDEDVLLDKIKTGSVEESGSFVISKLPTDINAMVFGESVFGEAVLGYVDYSTDEHMDNIKCAVQSDSASLACVIDSAENSTYNILNGRVQTRATSYDVITTKGEQIVVIH